MLKLYKFHWDCGQQGEIDSAFVAEEERVAEAIGKDVYFGEVLGKHSEVIGTLAKRDIKVLSDDQTFILQASQCGLVPVGLNPLDYLKGE